MQLDEKWYYFDTDGAMQTGWYTGITGFEGKLFYFDLVTGAMKTGWMQDGGSKWYYLDPDTGVMQTGWKLIDENMYFFHADGHMAVSEFVNNVWVDENGKAVTNEMAGS